MNFFSRADYPNPGGFDVCRLKAFQLISNQIKKDELNDKPNMNGNSIDSSISL